MTIGLQLYSLREAFGADAEGCVSGIQKAGFDRAEAFDLLHLKSIKPLLDDAGITVSSSFLLWSHITGRHDLARQINYPWMPAYWGIEHEIELAHELGLSTLVFGYSLPEERQNLDDFKRLSEQLSQAGETCRQAGLALLYHNHTFEFRPDSGTTGFDYLVENTSSEQLGFELDVFWVHCAGYAPVDIMRKLDQRLKGLHIKTGVCETIPLWDEQALAVEGHDYALGQGDVEIKPILSLAEQNCVEHVYIEQEFGADLYTSLARSLDYVKRVS